MKTGPTAEDTMPDTLSPDDALTLALTSKHFARHVVKRALGVPDPGPSTESTTPSRKKISSSMRQRANARAIRENKVKASEVKRPGPPTTFAQIRKGSYKPLWDGDQLRLKLQSYDRTPFLDLLAMWMECAPTPQTIMAFADRYPDRWTRALTELGRLGGFAEKKDIDVNFSAQVQRMSDSQLEDRLRDTAYKLGIPLPNLLTMMSAADPGPDPVDIPIRRADVTDVTDVTPIAGREPGESMPPPSGNPTSDRPSPATGVDTGGSGTCSSPRAAGDSGLRPDDSSHPSGLSGNEKEA